MVNIVFEIKDKSISLPNLNQNSDIIKNKYIKRNVKK